MCNRYKFFSIIHNSSKIFFGLLFFCSQFLCSSDNGQEKCSKAHRRIKNAQMADLQILKEEADLQNKKTLVLQEIEAIRKKQEAEKRQNIRRTRFSFDGALPAPVVTKQRGPGSFESFFADSTKK